MQEDQPVPLPGKMGRLQKPGTQLLAHRQALQPLPAVHQAGEGTQAAVDVCLARVEFFAGNPGCQVRVDLEVMPQTRGCGILRVGHQMQELAAQKRGVRVGVTLGCRPLPERSVEQLERQVQGRLAAGDIVLHVGVDRLVAQVQGRRQGDPQQVALHLVQPEQAPQAVQRRAVARPAQLVLQGFNLPGKLAQRQVAVGPARLGGGLRLQQGVHLLVRDEGAAELALHELVAQAQAQDLALEH